MKQKGTKIFRVIDKIVDLTAIVFLLIFLVYGGYLMWDTNTMYNLASSTAYAAYRPTMEEEIGFEELQAINPDVFGWITIYGTNINYPLVQGNDNHKYVYANAKGEPAMSGAIFLDFRNDQNFTDFNHIIYGHDMARNAMFGEIASFDEAYFFDSRRFGMIFTGDDYYGIEFFSFLLVDAHDFEIYNPMITESIEKEVLIERLFNEAIHYRELDITMNDRLVILSTCTPTATNGRYLLVGRLIDEVPEDTFDNVRTGPGIDNLFGMGWLELLLGSLLVISVTIGVTLFVIKRKKGIIGPDEEVEVPMKQITPEERHKRPTLLEEFLFLFAKIGMILIVVALVFTFIFGVTQEKDASMAPAMREGDIVFFQRIGGDFIANDAVVVREGGQAQVRRIVAVEGDSVDITAQGLVINGVFQQELHIFEETTQFVEGVTFPLIVPEGEVFILGDSRSRARDSRIYGTVRVDDILGRVITLIRRRNL